MTLMPATVGLIVRSDFDRSDAAPLMEIIDARKCPWLRFRLQRNTDLSDLGRPHEIAVEVTEVPIEGHMPLYTDPPERWAAIAGFLSRKEGAP